MSGVSISDPILKRIIYLIGILLLIILGFHAFNLLKDIFVVLLKVFMPFVIGFLLAYVLDPIVTGLQQRLKLGRLMGTLVLFSLINTGLFILLAFILPNLISEIVGLFNSLKEIFPLILAKLDLNNAFVTDIQNKIKAIQIDPNSIANYLLPGLKNLASEGFETFEKASKMFFKNINAVIGFFSFITFVLIINFYFIIDWATIRGQSHKIVPRQFHDRFFEIMEKVDLAVGGFLRGQLTVSIIVGTMFASGLFIMGWAGFPSLRSYCILIGTIAAIGGFIPYLGPVMGVTPAIIIILFTQNVTWLSKGIILIAVLMLFACIQAIEGFVLQPRIVGKGAGLHPLIVLFALLFGAQFGIGGMMVAVPIACVIRVLIIELYWKPAQIAAVDEKNS